MLYVSLDKNQIRLLALKKTLLGQFEVSYFEKRHEIDILNRGRVNSVDFLASAIKEGLNALGAIQDKEVCLILPQESFHFIKADVPVDIAPSALTAFIQDKARSVLATDADNYYSDYFVKEADKQKQLSYFAVDQETIMKYAEVLKLLSLKLVMVIPETLAVFKLFEKTLRKEKKENILFVNYTKDTVTGMVFDSGGLLVEERWIQTLSKEDVFEEILKKKKEELEAKGIKLNRIILSGEQSENVRQDTFTKAVGVWTNPLKRIIPDFYADHLKVLVTPDKPFPLLMYDVCFGAFIFSSENKEFHILKKPVKVKGGAGFSLSGFPLFRKEVGIFVLSAVFSFGIFVGLSKLNFAGLGLPKIDTSMLTSIGKPPTPSPTQAPSPTPTPAFSKETLKINVLNGSGTAGLASEVRDTLRAAGYQEILTGNADEFDVAVTTIAVKDSVKAAGPEIAEALADSVSSPKIETLADDEVSDVIVTIGSDYK